MSQYDTTSLDEILRDVKALLGEEEGPVQPQRRTEGPQSQPQSHEEAVTEPDSDFDWAAQNFIDDNIGPYTPPARRPQSPDRPAVNGPRTDAQRAVDHRQPRPAPQMSASDRLRQAPKTETVADEEPEDEKKRGASVVRKLIKIVIALAAILAIALTGAYFLLARQPIGSGKGLGERKDGVSTVLLAGTDADGTRTDTMMLLCVDAKAHTANLVSIPRDTFVSGGYNVPKINSAYGWGGKGEAGMQELMTRVTEIIGFAPDGYLLVDLDAFIELVDLMGGVKFEVPVEMHYADPSQNLNIDLSAGEQKLDGQQAMGLVRFRSTYARADLDRVEVQRAFVSAAARQWGSVKSVVKIPGLLKWYAGNVTTDLSLGNLAWLGVQLMRAGLDSAETVTLPGSAQTIWGGSYYCLDPGAVAQTVNELLNPYEQAVSAQDLSIRGY